MPTKKKTIKDQLSEFLKTTGIAIGMLSAIGAIVWNIWAKDLVNGEIKVAMVQHEKRVFPRVSALEKKDSIFSDILLENHFLLKKLTSKDEQIEAKKEAEEIKRRQ